MKPIDPQVTWSDWLHLPGSRPEVQFLVAAAIGLGLLAFCALHLRRRTLPGPLTQDERARARGAPWRRHLDRLAPIVLGGAAWYAAAQLAWPLASPEVLVLHSRARGGGEVAELLPWRRAAAVRDLGPVVDKILAESTDLCALWHEGGPGERRELTERIRRLAPREDARLLDHGAPSRPTAEDTKRWAGCPPDLIESLELSLIEVAASKYNLVQVRVAPRAFAGVSNWGLAKELLAARGIGIEIVDEHEIQLDRLRVRQIAGAHLDERGQPRFLAVIEGPVTKDTSLDFAVLGGGTEIDRFPVRLSQDGYLARIIAVEETSPITGVHCTGALSEPLWLRSTTPPIVEVPLACLPEIPKTQPLYVEFRTRSRWKKALESIPWEALPADPPKRPDPRARFVEELRIAEIVRPEVSSDSSDNKPALLTCEAQVKGQGKSQFLVIGTNLETASNAEKELRQALSRASSMGGAQPDLRVTENRLGPATVFSWQGLPFLPLYSTFGAALGREALLAAAAERSEIEDGNHRSSGTPHAWTVTRDAGRTHAVIVEVPGFDALLDADPSKPAYEIGARLALIRTVAWSAHYVTLGSDADELRNDLLDQDREAIIGRITGPSLTAMDLHELEEEERAVTDALGVASLGLYLLFLLSRIRRSVARQ